MGRKGNYFLLSSVGFLSQKIAEPRLWLGSDQHSWIFGVNSGNVLLKNPAVKGIQNSKLEMIWIPDVKRTMRKKVSFPYLPQPQRNKNRHKCFFFFAKFFFFFNFYPHSVQGNRYSYNYLPCWYPTGLFFWMRRQTLAGIILLSNHQRNLKNCLAGPKMLVPTWNTLWIKSSERKQMGKYGAEHSAARNGEKSWGGNTPSTPSHSG